MASTTKNPADTGSNWFVLAIAAVFILGAAGIAFAVSQSDGGDSGVSTVPSGRDVTVSSPVVIEGAPLTPFPGNGLVLDAGSDPAIGTVAPTISGEDFNNEAITIGPDGTAKVVMFLAHWCPHCQAEVPRVVDLIEAGKLPAGVELYAVSTSVQESSPNFPPNNWLNREDWNEFHLRDSELNEAMTSMGGTGFPFVVYLDGDNNVIGRSSGELDSSQIEAAWNATAAGLG